MPQVPIAVPPFSLGKRVPVLEARVRDEYVWPYAAIRSDVWYSVASKASDEPGWFWVNTKPQPTYALREHFELREAAPRSKTVEVHDAPADPPMFASEPLVTDREARLRPSALRRYGGVLPGIWMRARDLIAMLRPASYAAPGERRRQRLPAADFEFRTSATSDAQASDVNTATGPSHQTRQN